MRKIFITTILFFCFVLFYFTIKTAGEVFKASTAWQMPNTLGKTNLDHHIVLITQDLDTPFWDKVSTGARKQAQEEGAKLEVLGSYGNNQEEFLKKIEIAIYSKVDGIIVQGLDTDEFKELTKIKASSYGIPIITVANDVPMGESLRRTYVGSNQFLSGQIIARQLVSDMGSSGEVILMSDSQESYYQKLRVDGIRDILKGYPDIQIVDEHTDNNREQVIATTKNLLNRFPGVDAYVAVNAKFAEAMVQEIERRSNVEPFHIYSFDDDAETLSLLKEGKIDGIIEQSPETMGKISVNLLIKWLNNETIPLDLEGYQTNIQLLKADDINE